MEFQFDDDEIVKAGEEPKRFYDKGMTPIMQQSEIGEVIKELNSDIIDEKTNMSEVDFKAIINPFEKAAITCVDCLVSFNLLRIPALQVTRQSKRLSVSLGGTGREQVVRIAQGREEQQINKQGFGSKIAGLFKKSDTPKV